MSQTNTLQHKLKTYNFLSILYTTLVSFNVCFILGDASATAKGLWSHHNVVCVVLSNTFPARYQALMLSQHVDQFRNRNIPLTFDLNKRAAPVCPLPWPSSCSPTPLLTTGPRTTLQTLLSSAQKGCHFLPPHTKPVIAPGSQTRKNYICNHTWMFKHTTSSCGHDIWQILQSPKSFHTSLPLELNKYLKEYNLISEVTKMPTM